MSHDVTGPGSDATEPEGSAQRRLVAAVQAVEVDPPAPDQTGAQPLSEAAEQDPQRG